jgi:[protein-PII] uridylyltransferase
LLASVSQRRDLDDPTVVRNFARQIGTPENLNLLALLTFADSQGTSDKLWNGFKDSLLWQLHSRAMALLTGGSEFIRASKEQRSQLLQEVRDLAPRSLTEEEFTSHFESLPERYFEIHLPDQILDDLELAHRFIKQQVFEEDSTLSPVIKWQHETDRGYNLVKICTWDRAGLFSKIAGTFSAVGLNILSAQIFTRTDGIVLDKFFVNDARTGNLASREQHEKFDDLLDRGLTGENIDLSALIARQRETRPVYQAYAGEQMETQIRFDNDASETRTLIEVETEDRLGLLYAISETFAELQLDIFAARIVTERGAAIDSFYVCELDGAKINSTERQKAVEKKLREAIGKLEAVA